MTKTHLALLLMLLGVVAGPHAIAQHDADSRTVIGPRNVDLADGATALMAGDAEAGVRLTLRGLKTASTDDERLAGFSNLCAAYVLLGQFDTALDYCNRAIAINDGHWRSYNNRALAYIKLQRFAEAERDIAMVEQIRPNAHTLRSVKAILLDETDPVAPSIIIDDRRQPADDSGDE